MRHTLRVLLAAALLACANSPAIADEIGEVGTPVGLSLNTQSADTFLEYHGRLFLKAADGTIVEYRWGGVSCGTRVLSDAQFAALQAALGNNKMRIQVLHQIGQGNVKCVVGFTVAPKSAVKLVFP
jgi:hypothetical protein